MRFQPRDKVELHNGFPVIVTSIYSAHDGMAYRVKPDVSALTGADRTTLKSAAPYALTALESSRVQPRREEATTGSHPAPV